MSGTFDPKLGIIRGLTASEEARLKAKKLSANCVKIMEQMKGLPMEDLSVHTLAMLYDNTVRLPEFIKVFNGKVTALLNKTLPPEKG